MKQVGGVYPLDDVQSAALLLHVDLNVVIAFEAGADIKACFLKHLDISIEQSVSCISVLQCSCDSEPSSCATEVWGAQA